jgi:glutamate-1-semialdehyde aminotransferase
MVIGKALANGYPLAAIGGSREVMNFANQTWISSTTATEFVSLAAARATLAVFREQQVARHLEATGARLLKGLRRLADDYSHLGVVASGVPQMCYLEYADEQLAFKVAAACAAQGLLFKRNAYNFVSLAHDDAAVDRAVATLDEVLAAC